jgi:hypothetical protein
LLLFNNLFQNIGSVFNLISELAKNPDKGSLPFLVSDLIKVFVVQVWDKFLNEIIVFPQYIL